MRTVSRPLRLVVLVVLCALAAGLATRASSAAPARPAREHARRASAATPTNAGLPSRAHQIATLAAVTAHIHADYAQLASGRQPSGAVGPQNIVGYGIEKLWSRGVDGAGTTVAVVEGWTSPNLDQVITDIDREYHLPAARISTTYPTGRLPAHCPHEMQRLGSYGSCAGWAVEVDLDVASVHLIAPYARILVVVAPADGHADAAEGVAPPEMMRAVEDIATRHLADVISSSDGSGESTYSDGAAEITAQDPAELAAAAAGIPFVNATGDCGAAQTLAVKNGAACTRVPSVTTWADSPWVTAVGGSIPDLNARTGARKGSDPLWPAAGAGLSTVFARPSYQDGVASITHSAMRSLPDITMDSSDGTSEAAPLFAGVLALATQENAGRVLGSINPALYAIGPEEARAGIADVTRGNDTVQTNQATIPGFAARRGFDIASGWGTVNAPLFVPHLVAETRRLGDESAARAEARSTLAGLESQSLKVVAVPATGSAGVSQLAVSASGLLPNYPVSLSVDGQAVPLPAPNAGGDISTTVSLGSPLSTGSHTASLRSLLVTETARFST